MPFTNADFEEIEKKNSSQISKASYGTGCNIKKPCMEDSTSSTKRPKNDKVYIATYSLNCAKFNGRLLSVIEFENLMARNDRIL
jgi:hypothetical protein